MQRFQKYLRGIPMEQFDQTIGLIKKGSRKPCGCFGAHGARFFRLSPNVKYWDYEFFANEMEELIGLSPGEVSNAIDWQGRDWQDWQHWRRDNPFTSLSWNEHPATVLERIMQERNILILI